MARADRANPAPGRRSSGRGPQEAKSNHEAALARRPRAQSPAVLLASGCTALSLGASTTGTTVNLVSQLGFTNTATGHADTLALTVSGPQSQFGWVGFTPAGGLVAGDTHSASISLAVNGSGHWEETLTIFGRSQNRGGYDGVLDAYTLTVVANAMASAVPEPTAVALSLGTAALLGARWLRHR